MAHSPEHEDKIVGYALADPADPEARDREGLLRQVDGCGECLAFGYRALADLPRLAAVAGVRAEAVAALRARWDERLGSLLLEAIEGIAERDGGRPADLRAEAARRSRIWRRILGPALGVALAAGLAGVWLNMPGGRRGTVPSTQFLEAQLGEVTGVLPVGYSFSPSSLSSPFCRGYGWAFLRDAEAVGIQDVRLEEVRGALARAAGDGRTPAAWREEGCAVLAHDAGDQEACRQGAWAYELRRGIEGVSDPASARVLLRSAEARQLLFWIRREAVTGRLPPALAGEAGALELRLAAPAPDRDETTRWGRLLRALLARG